MRDAEQFGTESRSNMNSSAASFRPLTSAEPNWFDLLYSYQKSHHTTFFTSTIYHLNHLLQLRSRPALTLCTNKHRYSPLAFSISVLSLRAFNKRTPNHLVTASFTTCSLPFIFVRKQTHRPHTGFLASCLSLEWTRTISGLAARSRNLASFTPRPRLTKPQYTKALT